MSDDDYAKLLKRRKRIMLRMNSYKTQIVDCDTAMSLLLDRTNSDMYKFWDSKKKGLEAKMKDSSEELDSIMNQFDK